MAAANRLTAAGPDDPGDVLRGPFPPPLLPDELPGSLPEPGASSVNHARARPLRRQDPGNPPVTADLSRRAGATSRDRATESAEPRHRELERWRPRKPRPACTVILRSRPVTRIIAPLGCRRLGTTGSWKRSLMRSTSGTQVAADLIHNVVARALQQAHDGLDLAESRRCSRPSAPPSSARPGSSAEGADPAALSRRGSAARARRERRSAAAQALGQIGRSHGCARTRRRGLSVQGDPGPKTDEGHA